ncbi:flagellar basal body protein, partial [Microbacteriaceae bacterium K1510]|nr:flagellar basal body protein [Microbacteriaceae bacterium K1510]
KRGLFAQQSALNTTGHNISNANTEGYTRQRANMKATAGVPYVGLSASREPGLLGTGVTVTDLQRIRDEFLDVQYR